VTHKRSLEAEEDRTQPASGFVKYLPGGCAPRRTMQRHGDVVGESILSGLGVAGLVAFGRGVRQRWHSTFRL
jgi:hypothetical protein